LLDSSAEVTEGSTPRLGDIFVNEVFRAQLEYLGDVQDASAPRFYRAWAADRDLLHPKISSLDVRVFLTRNQLNNLARSLQLLVDTAKAAATSADTLFDDLQTLAATTSIDPSRDMAKEERTFVLGKLLPAFLAALPYRSRVLQLDKQLWLDLGLTGQKEFLDDLEAKLSIYKRINEDQDNWVDFGAQDPGLEMFAIKLEQLP
jgi:serine/threonine-protein kinase PpkA